ncbi:MAG: ShlB/FhaC/HecB family hemolysin secretion/activation protein [Methylococcaceae bacterium]
MSTPYKLLSVALLSVSATAYGLPVVEESQRFLDKPALPDSHQNAPVLPSPAPATENSSSTASTSLFLLKKINLQGNSLFSKEQLAEIIKPYENRQVSADDLRQLRQDLTQFYLKQGYLNSGAILPKQDIKNGELQVQIIEGKLTELHIEGLSWLHDSYVRPRIAANPEKPLNVKDLQENLQLLQQNPLIKRIHAELTPGLQMGTASLNAKIEENRPYFLTLGTSNNGVPSVGAERFEAWGGHRDLLGLGDSVIANVNQSEGQTQYGVEYSIPLNRFDTSFNVHYANSEADVVEKPFNQLNIFNQSESIAIGISQPLWRTIENQITIGLTAEHRHSAAFLSGQQYSFSRGSVDGVSNVSALRFSQEWLNHTDKRVIALRSVANWGVNALDATIHKNSNLPDGEYFFWLGQGQWIQRLWQTGMELHLQSNLQLASDSLLSVEQYALGGMNSVRGYRKNQVVHDSGFASSLELRIPLFDKQLGDGVLHLAPFFDIGRAWSAGNNNSPATTLSSVGIGVHIDPNKQWHLECYWAQALKTVQTTGTDSQDSGIYFAVNYSPFNN